MVDTLALIEVLLGQPEAPRCLGVLTGPHDCAISAGTLAEALIVALGKGIRPELEILVGRFGFEVQPVDKAMARACADAYRSWGKGFHPAGLNYGDCFAYTLAIELQAPLLFVGDDFGRTDVKTIGASLGSS